MAFKKFFNKGAWTPIPSGDGQKLSFRASTNATWYQYYSVSFTEPWVGGKKPNSLSASVSYQIQTNGYKKSDWRYAFIRILGLQLGYGQQLKWPDDYFQLSHTFLYQRYQVNNYGSVFIFSNGYSNSFSYILSILRNSVDAPIYPRQGSEIVFSVQLTPPYSLFSTKNYANVPPQEKYKWLEMHKWKFQLKWYTKIVENFVLSIRLKSGFIGCYNILSINSFARMEKIDLFGNFYFCKGIQFTFG
jgi:outer membrane protein insertion porin family